MPTKMTTASNPILDPRGSEVPKFHLIAYSFESFTFRNVKELERNHDVKLIKSTDVPLNFFVNTTYTFIDKEKLIQCQVKFIIDYKSKTLEFNLAEFQIAFDFRIDDYDSYKKENKYTFSNHFLAKINEISISTSRGLLSSKFSNTYLQNLFVPVLVPAAPDQNSKLKIKERDRPIAGPT